LEEHSSTLSNTDPDLTAERIKALRNRLGLTQAQLGAQLGVSQKIISAWEINGLPRRYKVVFKLLELERKAARRKRR
jgi:DNA-binding transcriptional regulator YiaG